MNFLPRPHGAFKTLMLQGILILQIKNKKGTQFLLMSIQTITVLTRTAFFCRESFHLIHLFTEYTVDIL